MQILIAATDPRWDRWTTRILSPLVAAFDHKRVHLFAPIGTAAFDLEFEKATAECDAVIALNPSAGEASPPVDWPCRALEISASRQGKAALIRAPREKPCYSKAPSLLDCDPEGSCDSIVAVARLLASWRPARKARFLLGPPSLTEHLTHDFAEHQVVVEYSIDSPYYVNTRWLAAERSVSPGQFEVRTQSLPPDSRIRIRVSAPDGAYESQPSPIDRRIMEIGRVMAVDPRESPQLFLAYRSAAS